MRVEFSLEARARLQEIDGYYNERSTKAAERFLQEVEDWIKTISSYPETGILYRKKFRLFPMNNFPYLIVCEAYPQYTLITTIIHKRRHPKFRTKRAQ